MILKLGMEMNIYLDMNFMKSGGAQGLLCTSPAVKEKERELERERESGKREREEREREREREKQMLLNTSFTFAKFPKTSDCVNIL
jgi:hypothetical protein